jgi:mannose-6-phosphate isomerase-like protein (cupin superfamily)
MPALVVAFVLLALPVALEGQRFVKQTERLDYTLTVESDSPATVNAWWKPFQEKAAREGYCFDLPNMPLVDRPELGDKAVIIKAGGVGQLVQLIEIPPGGQTKWHGYGWEGEALFYVLSGRGETEFRSVGGLPTNKYTWKRNSLFAIPVDHQMQHRNLDKTQPLRLVAWTGYAINLYPYVAEELRSGRQNPAEGPEERAATLARTTYPGHYVDDLREHPVAMREARGNKTAFFNTMATAGHRTHPNVHISELTGPEAYAHKHGNQPMFIILKGKGYDIWSEAADLKAYEASVKAKTAHTSPYDVGTMCAVPAGPHWHQHFSTGTDPLRYLAVVPRGQYEDKPPSQQ